MLQINVLRYDYCRFAYNFKMKFVVEGETESLSIGKRRYSLWLNFHLWENVPAVLSIQGSPIDGIQEKYLSGLSKYTISNWVSPLWYLKGKHQC